MEVFYLMQTTLDQWIRGNEDKPKDTFLQYRELVKADVEIEIPQTISCIELDMKPDSWMEGEPKSNNWDGSLDNQEKILEKHISKYGWEF